MSPVEASSNVASPGEVKKIKFVKEQDMDFVFSEDLKFETELMVKKYLVQYKFKPVDRINKEKFLGLFKNLGIT